MKMENKTLEKKLDEKVDEILATNTISKAQEIMASRKGLWLIAVISFIESATPIPVVTDPFMMAAILLDRANYLRTIFITTVASVLGGIAAYFTAYFFIDVLLNLFSPTVSFELARFTTNTEHSTFVLTLIGAFTPVPYTFTAWAIGLMQGSLIPFIAASIIGRGGRYIIGGWLTYRFGTQAVARARRSIGITSVILIILAAGYFWLKL
jgi:membrane protein YqaA with SNARE-associated domain